MANINVTYQEMLDAAGKLNTGKEEITTQLNDLKGFIANLISNGFVTEQASVKFGETYNTFTTNATNTINALEGLSEYLKSAAQAMSDTDTQLAAGLG
ncbi:MAG: WXG100 family type VII secretion target [Propionibacteriaceae bacterium]|jgi:WXG100 family type VII secretion target|nr:WXG100 family type VII secretion target [Propionibacteriaceae bacterium]